LSGQVEGSEHKSVSISSLIFSRVTRRGDDAVVDMLGAPIIDENVIGCPMALQAERRCRPMALEVPGGKTPEEVYRSDLGVDISGQAEAQIISGILAELKHGSRLHKEDTQ
jgi:hypothetical protein